MNARTATTVIAGAAAVLMGATLAPSASAAQTHDTMNVDAVFFGPAQAWGANDLRGNRHQVHLSSADGPATGYVRSWFCPYGVTVTPTWVSSKCVHRSTMRLKSFGHIVRISSTGRSARLVGGLRATNYSGYGVARDLEVNLTVFRREVFELSGRFAEAPLDWRSWSRAPFARTTG